MKGIAFLLFVFVTVVALIASTAPASGQDDGKASPVFGIKIYPGYRDWKFVSTAHEAGTLNSIGAVLGNDTAIKAYREGKLPFPDGTVIVALHYSYVPSDENNKVFGGVQSFVAAPRRTFSSW